MKQVTMREFLTSEEVDKAVSLYTYHRPAFHNRCRDEIIKPVMDRINADLGQENDPDYLVYAIEYVLSKI
jgi:hypothetical protein